MRPEDIDGLTVGGLARSVQDGARKTTSSSTPTGPAYHVTEFKEVVAESARA